MLLKSHTESLGGFKSQYMHTEDTDHHQFCPVLQLLYQKSYCVYLYLQQYIALFGLIVEVTFVFQTLPLFRPAADELPADFNLDFKRRQHVLNLKPGEKVTFGGSMKPVVCRAEQRDAG